MRDRPVLLVVAVGAAAGFLAGLFGVGGGILIVPGLILAVQLEQRLAHGTSLAAVIPISIASMATYALRDNVDWTVAGLLIVGSVMGVVVGTAYLHVAEPRTLRLLFAVVLLVSAIRLFVPIDADGRVGLSVLGGVAVILIGVASGGLAGVLGVGGGIIMVPAMILGFSILPVVAKGTSAAAIIPAALIGTLRNRSNNNADMPTATIVGIAGILTAVAGGVVSDHLDDDVAVALFAVLLTVVAARLLWQLRRPVEPVPSDA
jgi:uncharacterized membrane protein YfcA